MRVGQRLLNCPLWGGSLPRRQAACQLGVFCHQECYRRDKVLSNENVTEGIMSADEKMTVNERRKVLKKVQTRYQRSSHQERSRLLDDPATVLGMHRKSVSRSLNGDLARRPRPRQRGRTYGLEAERAPRVHRES